MINKHSKNIISNSGHIVKIITSTIKKNLLLSFFILFTVIGEVVISLLPPLVLGVIVDKLVLSQNISLYLAIGYFAIIIACGLFEGSRDIFLTIFGQKITHAIRSTLMLKMTTLNANTLSRQEPGSIVSRFVGDVDTVETLFTSGIISMVADACKIISILFIIFFKNKGLSLLLLIIIPVIFVFTRFVQTRMLTAQLANRIAISRVTNHVPETIKCIRTIHNLSKEDYMKEKYKNFIDESYRSIEKTNFYDAIYSPVILIFNAVIVAIVMLLSASNNSHILTFFGMSVGTSVSIINYISQIFLPIESLGMEIQTIQSAVTGVKRINEFLDQPSMEKPVCEAKNTDLTCNTTDPVIEFKDITFSYDDNKVILKDMNFTVNKGEKITLSGRTGAGKSTIFKLLLGLYPATSGNILINGIHPQDISDKLKRSIFGYVEQSFKPVCGSVKDQITLFDDSFSDEQIENASRLVGLHKTIMLFPNGYDTPYKASLFSQGQQQLLSIARAVLANPQILLLDEITANLDAQTEQNVLEALNKASKGRTTLSISHRIYTHDNGRIIHI